MGGAMTKLIFLATEDWFVASHFLPLLRRAQADGHDVAVAARDSGALQDAGVRVIAMPFARGSLDPISVAREAHALRKMLCAERPDILHAIALKPIVLALAAGAQGAARAFALTGRGFLATSRAEIVSHFLAPRLRRALDDPRSALVVENTADRAWAEAGRPLPDARVALMPGAGIDPTRYAPAAEPAAPITIGLAARLVRSKGVDVAVEAVRRLNADGLSLRLRIAGEVDADNPRGVSAATLAQWRATPGVTLLGRVLDIPAFWADAHIACLPSRGGEGLPRSLLEAAACGRPIVTTNTPGCADFVRDGHDGLIVAPDDPAALALALRTLALDETKRRAFGASARARVLMGYTEAHAADVASAAWTRLLSRPPA
jgi:glycosyltransferase involved in cell wall biosynthesis